MKKIILSFIFCAVLTSAFSQSTEGNIEMHKSFWGVTFKQDGRQLRPRQVLDIMKDNPEAYAEFKKAKTNYDAGSAFAFVGGFLIGWPLGTAIGGGDPEWGLAAAGAGVLLFTIPFNSGFKKHARNAITIYNGTSSRAHTHSLSIVPYGTGARIVFRF
ncbi:MAG TPA: hypothetical protein VGK59_17450 [Ohtaekwangia sp.]